MNIRLFKPFVGKEELENIQKVFDHAWLGLGPFVEEFEREWSSYIGIRESIGVNSCTAALHLSLAAWRFPQGKKVLVPAITFVSTAHAVLYNDLEPVFVDVEDGTLTLSIEDFEKKLSKDTVAVIPVHVGGQAVAMDHLVPIARRHGLKIVEDCANCAGGEYRGRKLGTWGDIGCFSFEEKKNMTTGDGGMISSDDVSLISPLRQHRWVGIDKDTWRRERKKYQGDVEEARHWYYEVSVLGYKYNMNDIMAAIGLAQLKKLDDMNKRRAHLIQRYLNGLGDARIIRPALRYDLKNSAYWLFVIKLPEQHRDNLIVYLRKRGVATGVHFMPVPLHPLYAKYNKGIQVASGIWKEVVTLPLFPELSEDEVDYVIQLLQDFEKGI